jgi:hypothetical protein
LEQFWCGSGIGRSQQVMVMADGFAWNGQTYDSLVAGLTRSCRAPSPTFQQIAARQKCSARQVNMTISLAFLAPGLVRAAVECRLPRGIGVSGAHSRP